MLSPLERLPRKLYLGPQGLSIPQAKSNAIVSGDVIIDFFARNKKFLRDDPLLVLIVPHGFQEGLEEFLKDDGYAPIDEGSDTRHTQYWGYTNCEYVHSSRSTGGTNRTKILLCVAGQSVALTFSGEMGCDTSLSHGFVTWNKAYSLFPRETFVQRQGYFLMPNINNARHHETGDQLRLQAAAGYEVKDP